MWRAIADRELTHDVQQWLVSVAEAILDADSKQNDKLRYAAIVDACGLAGRHDPEADFIRTVVLTVDHTSDLIERGNQYVPARPLRKGERNERRRDAVRRALLGEKPLDPPTDAALDKRIARALAGRDA